MTEEAEGLDEEYQSPLSEDALHNSTLAFLRQIYAVVITRH